MKRLAIVEGDGTEVAVLNWMGRALLGRNGAPQVTLDRVGLTLRDGNGVTRGEFAVLPLKTDHAPALQIYDRDGQLRFSCGATSDLGPVIFLNEKDGMTGTMVDERGIFIDLRGEEGQPYRGAIALTGQDPWGLVLENRLGARADVGLPPDGSVCACA